MKFMLRSTAAAVLMLGVPALGAPDHQGGERGNSQPQSQSQAPSRSEGGAKSKRPDSPQRDTAPRAQAAPQRDMGANIQSGRRMGAAAQSAPASQAQGRPQQAGRASPQATSGGQGQGRQQSQASQRTNSQIQTRTGTQPGPSSQATATGRGPGNGGTSAAGHSQQRTQWAAGHANWNQNTVWQRDRNWWRGNAGFGSYTGARLNFFFAPGFGYYRVPQEYWGHSWQTGAYLPLYFLRYQVSDYRAYGLPVPPYGCSWVWVNNGVFLIDRSDGYILDEIANVW